MKRLIFFSCLYIGFLETKAQTSITDTVSILSGYTQRAYYSVDNGEVLNVSNNDWDIAFSCSGPGAAGSAILINEATSTLYASPYDTSMTSWNNFDTTGAFFWPQFLNSDTTWTNGAFNRWRGARGLYDMGWGMLDPNNNFWTFGDSLYMVKISNGTFKKLRINSLKSGVWEFTYANLDGSSDTTITITKANYPNRNFIYYSMVTHQILDKEPNNNSWELLFLKHREYISNIYVSVSGLLTNKNIWTAKSHLNSFNDALNATTPQTPFTQKINNIGFEWKKYSSQTGWMVYDTIAYFLYNKDSSRFYRIIFTGFGGSSNGNFIFHKTLIKNVGLNGENHSVKELSIYPNPSSNGEFTLLYEIENPCYLTVLVTDLQGHTIYENSIFSNKGIFTHFVKVPFFARGLYLLTIKENNVPVAHQKIILKE